MMAKPADKNIQSGNSRVKVTIFGQVNRAIRFANTGDSTEITSVDNDGSSSQFGVRAVGRANPNLTIGSLVQLEWRNNHRSATNEGNSGDKTSEGKEDMRVRHVDLWLDHKNLGKLSMGQGSMAGDASGLFELTGVSHVYGFAGANGTDGTKADASVRVANVAGTAVETVSATGKARGYRPFNFFGFRQNRIRYDTPSLMGARLSASYGHAKTWSVGLTYAGAPPGVKNFSALFAAGYRKNDNDTTAIAVSGGIKHSSGFNVSGSYDADGEADSKGVKESQWGVSAGWTGKVNDAGATSIGIGFNRSGDGIHGTANQYWVAINQNVDSAAADVYAGISFDSGSVTHTTTAAEVATAYVPAAAETQTTDATPGARAAVSPCYTPDAAGTGVENKGTVGGQCEVERDGVMNFVVGVRIKF